MSDQFDDENLRSIARHLEDAFNELESVRYQLRQLNESEVAVAPHERLDRETIGRLFLALDWFETRGTSIAEEAREAVKLLPFTARLEVGSDV